ncbi:unnamed protein product [Jaminaea pallidilutea]
MTQPGPVSFSDFWLVVVPTWSYILVLIFGGCCSNAYYLELCTRQAPELGTVITVGHFFFTMLVALPSQLTWGQSDRGQHLDKKAHSTARRGDWHILGPFHFKRNAVPLNRWIVQVVLYSTTSLLNNVAFAYDVPMPVHIIFRSGGLVVNLIMGWAIRGKRYSALQVTSVMLVTAGVILSTLSTTPATTPDQQSVSASAASPAAISNYVTGIILLSIALVLSSLMGIWQELTFAQYGSGHWQEALFYSHLLSLPLIMATRGSSLREEWQTVLDSPQANYGFRWTRSGAFKLDFGQRSSKMASIEGVFDRYSASFSLPSLMPLLALNILTQLACINGVNRLTAKVSSVGVTLVLVVRKAVSLAISVLIMGGTSKSGHDDKTSLTVGALAVGLGTIGYAWSSTRGHSDSRVGRDPKNSDAQLAAQQSNEAGKSSSPPSADDGKIRRRRVG